MLAVYNAEKNFIASSLSDETPITVASTTTCTARAQRSAHLADPNTWLSTKSYTIWIDTMNYYTTGSSESFSTYSPTIQQGSPHTQHPSKPGDVPNTVHQLIGSTKRLQEILNLWSVNRATEGDVSDLYVQIGHEFNALISAFAFHQIDLSNIHDFPASLRAVLEQCLAEDQSPQVLEMFQPQLRKVIFKLLTGLQAHVKEYRAASARAWGESQSQIA